MKQSKSKTNESNGNTRTTRKSIKWRKIVEHNTEIEATVVKTTVQNYCKFTQRWTKNHWETKIETKPKLKEQTLKYKNESLWRTYQPLTAISETGGERKEKYTEIFIQIFHTLCKCGFFFIFPLLNSL